MKKEVKLRRNIYIILIGILLLSILSQVARSQYVLEFNEREDLYNELKQLASINSSENIVEDLYENDESNYCLLFNRDDQWSVALKNNTQQVLYYMKQPYRLIDLSEQTMDYTHCETMLFTASLSNLAGEEERLISYVEDGGYMFIMRMSQDESVLSQLYRKIGIIDFRWIDSSFGIHLTSNVLIGQEGLALGEDFIYNNSLYLALDDQAELLAESKDGIPLMWKRTYGNGAFVVFNGDSLHLKVNRGLVTGGISLLVPDYIYPIYNSKLFYIDDFPSPEKERDPKITRDYGMTVPNFYRQIWWPDMLKAAKKYDVKYTAVAIQSYEDRVTPPFEDPVDEEKYNLIAYGREVIKSGGEVGIHGYNHQSLTMNNQLSALFDYRSWESREHMVDATREVLSYLDEAFPNYPVMTYVPPSNVLAPEGREALKEAWPNLAVISSLYDTDFTNRSYVQEYGMSPDGIIELPRVTSGYFSIPYDIWLEANTITSIGIFSHFIHPDDLMDVHRSNNKKWDDLYKDFVSMLDRLQDTYPWLRSMTSTEAGLDLVKVQQMQMQVEHQENEINVQTTASDKLTHYYILRSKHKITKNHGCNVQLIDENTYLVTAWEADFSIGIGR